MKIVSALGALFALLSLSAGEIRFEKPAQSTSWIYGPGSSIPGVRFTAVGGSGGGILNSVTVEVSNETGGAFRGARLKVDGKVVGELVPFANSRAVIPIGLVTQEGGRSTFDVELVAADDIRTFSGTTAIASIVDANTGGDLKSGLPVSGSPFTLRDTRAFLRIEKTGGIVVIQGKGEKNVSYRLQFTSDFVSWADLGLPTRADDLGNFSRSFPSSELQTPKGFFRAEAVD